MFRIYDSAVVMSIMYEEHTSSWSSIRYTVDIDVAYT